MQFNTLAQAACGFTTFPIEELRQLAHVLVDQIRTTSDRSKIKIIDRSCRGMVASLDPHSAYLDKKAYELRKGTQGKFVGLGSKRSGWKTAMWK
jgi:carboxyl-terminal processing protease